MKVSFALFRLDCSVKKYFFRNFLIKSFYLYGQPIKYIMDFKDSIKQISDRVSKLKNNLLTEEATKNALIMPFLTALGYDVFNPLEVVPEMSCDIGTKKGEKIDYAIMKDGEPTILVECKHWQQELTLYDNQLLRYFNVSKAKFGILTNGIIYRFYTDLIKPNVMDEKPFLEINMEDLKDTQVEELKKFHKSYFDVDNILSSASELKYVGELKTILNNEFQNPTAEFVKYFGKQVYDGMFTPKVLDQFTSLVKRTFSSLVNDMIQDRLKAAIKDQEPIPTEQIEESTPIADKASSIVTTAEEIESYYIVKSILRGLLPAERITYRDTQSYCSILLDDTIRKIVCRLYLNNSNKRLAILDDNKKEIFYKLDSIDSIYEYSEQIKAAAMKFL